jgi:hypothetical protein
MKNLIKNILREETDLSPLEKYTRSVFRKQIEVGDIPHIPYHDFINRKLIPKYYKEITKSYFSFLEEMYGVNGFEKSKTLFHNTIDIITQDDLKNVGMDTGNDLFKVDIPWIEYNSKTNEMVYGFKILDCYLETEYGMKTLSELLSNNTPDYVWNDVTEFLIDQISEYFEYKSYSFGLPITNITSVWAD